MCWILLDTILMWQRAGVRARERGRQRQNTQENSLIQLAIAGQVGQEGHPPRRIPQLRLQGMLNLRPCFRIFQCITPSRVKWLAIHRPS